MVLSLNIHMAMFKLLFNIVELIINDYTCMPCLKCI